MLIKKKYLYLLYLKTFIKKRNYSKICYILNIKKKQSYQKILANYYYNEKYVDF